MGQHTKVITNKTDGKAFLQIPDYDEVTSMTPVFVTWLDSGSPAPLDLSKSVRLDDNVVTLERTAASDVYLFPVKQDIPVLVDA